MKFRWSDNWLDFLSEEVGGGPPELESSQSTIAEKQTEIQTKWRINYEIYLNKWNIWKYVHSFRWITIALLICLFCFRLVDIGWEWGLMLIGRLKSVWRFTPWCGHPMDLSSSNAFIQWLYGIHTHSLDFHGSAEFTSIFEVTCWRLSWW